jgi:hypothetical protein
MVCAILASAAGGGEPASPAGAPGEVSLTVWEQGGAARTNDIVTGGIPLPEGAVADPAAELRVLDAAGKVLPAQFLALDRWWATPNKSPRWCLVSFPASVEAGAKAKYTLKLAAKDSPKPPETALKVTEEADAVTVVTGPLKLVVSKKSFNLFDGVWLDANGDGKFGDDERVIASSADSGAVVTVDDWAEEGLKTGDKYYSAAGPAKKVVVEEGGPVRACVFVQGAHLPRGAGFAEGVYDYKVRIYAYAGQPYVRVFYELSNGRLAKVIRPWPFKGLDLVVRLQGGAASAKFLGEDGKVVEASAAEGAELLQNVDDTKTKGAEPFFKVSQGGKDLSSGGRSLGAMDVSGTRFGVTAAVKYFDVMCPKGLAADKEGLRVGLFPEKSGKKFYVLPGRKRTHELVCLFHAGKGGEKELKLARALAVQELRPVAAPEWYQKSQAWFGGLSIVPAASCPHLDVTPVKAPGLYATWYAYGWILRDWNAGGSHPQQACGGFPFMITGGENSRLVEAESMARWVADSGIGMVWDVPSDFSVLNKEQWASKLEHDFYVCMGSCKFDSNSRFKAYKLDIEYRVWPDGPKLESGGPYEMIRQRPDSGHLGFVVLHELYRLTGDRSVLAGMEASATASRSLMRIYVCGSRLMFVEKDDPEDPEYKMQDRYCGWPLYEIAEAYARTGNPVFAREASFIVKGARNRARTSPVGFIAQPNDPNYKEGYGGRFGKRDGFAQCDALFQTALLAHGLAMYWRDTGDEEALDTLTAFADNITHFAMERTPEGKMKGWNYVWTDAWEQSDPKQFLGFGSSNMRLWRPFGEVYNATGREDYRAVSNSVSESLGDRWLAAVQIEGQAALYPHQCPKEDKLRPAAVKDLHAEARGNGEAKVTWTALGGDGDKGQAAWYQLKYSPDPIVERIKDWPDRTPPLPQSEKEWEAKAAAFMAKNGRPFWSAVNCKGEPVPGLAGTKESFTAKGLKPGKLHFALKTYDQAHNQSELSNVAEVEVK